MTTLALHMLSDEDWVHALASGHIAPRSLVDEGFVHCTDAWLELANVADRYYAGDPRPYVAAVLDLERIGEPWRYDDAARIYPHVYGPIPIASVVTVRRLPRAADGHFTPRPEDPMNALAPLLDRLDAAATRLAGTRGAVERGAPWPVGAVASGGPEHDWSPTEVLAHISEMLPYWLGEIERVVAGGGAGSAGPTAFGRVATDQIRSLTVERDATLPVRELYDRIAAGVQRYRLRLPLLSEDEIGRTGVHPTRGELAVPQMLERFVVGHLEEHAEQLETSLRG